MKELKHTRALRGLIGAEASRDLRLLVGRLESRIERFTNDYRKTSANVITTNHSRRKLLVS